MSLYQHKELVLRGRLESRHKEYHQGKRQRAALSCIRQKGKKEVAEMREDISYLGLQVRAVT